MKKVFFILVVSLLLSVGVFADDTVKIDAIMKPGNMGIYAGIGTGVFWGALDFSGGFEAIFSQYDIGDSLPITFGVAVRGGIFSWKETWVLGDYYYTYLGGGVFATAHLGFTKDSVPENLQFLANTDFYVGLGPQFYSYSYGYSSSKVSNFIIGFGSTGGINYFLTDNFAINLEGGYYGYYGGGIIGVLFKF
ncbi:hypothetical protein WKV44_03995 [Spirochaetia bacterium 38H-sp]|uniref:Outer membrane protein beta-barrel domain-containing protein n=1 Tax=Rarispira pelagica TaxID=3141764 RepID=A0ABU9UAK7_9SPIR